MRVSKIILVLLGFLFSNFVWANSLASGELYQAAQAWLNKDYTKAYHLFETLAKTDLPQAQDRLASCYYFGQGVPKDYTRAFYWYQRAAQKNILSAQYMMAHMYLQGEGIKKNYKEAAAQLLHIAKIKLPALSSSVSSNNLRDDLATMDLQNRRNAMKRWILLAQRDLGDIYFAGHGVEQNMIKSYAWYSLVAKRGDQQSQLQQAKILQLFNKQDQQQAQKLAQAYENSYGV